MQPRTRRCRLGMKAAKKPLPVRGINGLADVGGAQSELRGIGFQLSCTASPHLPEVEPLMPVIDQVEETQIPLLKTQRIQSAVEVPKDGKTRSALVTYLRLQNGSWRTWAVIWALQNVRYLPV